VDSGGRLRYRGDVLAGQAWFEKSSPERSGGSAAALCCRTSGSFMTSSCRAFQPTLAPGPAAGRPGLGCAVHRERRWRRLGCSRRVQYRRSQSVEGRGRVDYRRQGSCPDRDVQRFRATGSQATRQVPGDLSSCLAPWVGCRCPGAHQVAGERVAGWTGRQTPSDLAPLRGAMRGVPGASR
jgi:hypothetical protein